VESLQLPLAIVGWLFTLLSAAALALSVMLVVALLKSGERGQQLLSYSFVNDLVLAGIWVIGLAGGIGVLRLQPWGRSLLELFCWALIVLAPLSAATRLYALRQPDPNAPPVNWLRAVAGVTLVLVPILVICAATIVTLRSPEAQRLFSGN
jgi:hypothetical protein